MVVSDKAFFITRDVSVIRSAVVFEWTGRRRSVAEV
jgi:hypothetical protein